MKVSTLVVTVSVQILCDGLQDLNIDKYVTLQILAPYVQFVLYVHLLCWSPHRLQLPAIKTGQCHYWLWITLGSKHKHAFTPLTLQSSYELEHQLECWPSKSFHLHQTAGSAGSADYRQPIVEEQQHPARSSPQRTWYHYWSFTM